ncbi:MAG: sensor histidine kinase [Phenylobacterium sp.]|uniref:sensor histidine kinase n=1 Tax=Phenylobacterium sp. TaxID=1871053 RepID=UPI00391D2648
MSDAIDFAEVFEDLASPHMILDRELRYVAANAAYVRTLGRSREELLGRVLFDVFPNEDEGGRLLRASFQRVLDTGRRDSIAHIPYAIARSDRPDEFEMRYWSAVHTPILGADGAVAFIVQNTVDVTEMHRLKQIAYGSANEARLIGETQLLQRAAEVQQANQALLEETNRLRDLFMQAPGFLAVLAVPDLSFSFVNKAYLQMVGDRPLIGRTLADALPELADQGFIDLMEQTVRTREPYIGRSMRIMLRRKPGAALEERFVDFIFQPIFGADGQTLGVLVEGSDVTDRVHGEAQQKLLVDELNHRVKNTLATVQAISAQTLRTSPDPQVFRQNFEARLMALSATHDLLTATGWESASLRELLLMELGPHGPERYRLSGLDVKLAPSAALRLGLVFHELVTNAAKYGALSNGHGFVDIAWTVELVGDERRLQLQWTESGGPPVDRPRRRGFGSRLLERSLGGETGGGAALDFARDGLRCSLALPLAEGPGTQIA